MSEVEAFEQELADRGSDEPAMVVDVEGFEGPLDLLLALARQQKVDLAKISILALAEQYLVFIEAARKLRLELAADYLVMAAWLAYLKSRLLLPEPATPDGRPILPTASRRWSSMSRAMKVRSICCSRSRGSRRSISPRFRSWRWPINICSSSRRRERFVSSSPPTIS